MNFDWRFIWKWCGLCDKAYVECPKCKNNTCNGGYGTDIMGDECNVCPLAYQYEQLAYLTKSHPKDKDDARIVI
jgi:hypothetical protein